MVSLKKYGAIDIGSNAIRLLISNVIEREDHKPQFKKSSLVRVPIRLGVDSFVHGVISDTNIQRMIDAMEAFKLLMGIHGVEKYKACATSAMVFAKLKCAHLALKRPWLFFDCVIRFDDS